MKLSTNRINRLYMIQVGLLVLLLALPFLYVQWADFGDWVDQLNTSLAPGFEIVISLLSLLLFLYAIRTALAHKTKHGIVFLVIGLITAVTNLFLSPASFVLYYPLLLLLFLMYAVEGLILYGHYLVCLRGCQISYD